MKRYIAMTAALTLCISMAACGDSGTESSSAAETTTAAETEATEEPEEEAIEDEEEEYEFGYAEAPEGIQEYRFAGYGFMGDTYSFDSDEPIEATIEAGQLYAIDWANIVSIVVK